MAIADRQEAVSVSVLANGSYIVKSNDVLWRQNISQPTIANWQSIFYLSIQTFDNTTEWKVKKNNNPLLLLNGLFYYDSVPTQWELMYFTEIKIVLITSLKYCTFYVGIIVNFKFAVTYRFKKKNCLIIKIIRSQLT